MNWDLLARPHNTLLFHTLTAKPRDLHMRVKCILLAYINLDMTYRLTRGTYIPSLDSFSSSLTPRSLLRRSFLTINRLNTAEFVYKSYSRPWNCAEPRGTLIVQLPLDGAVNWFLRWPRIDQFSKAFWFTRFYVNLDAIFHATLNNCPAQTLFKRMQNWEVNFGI
jgi:hypothetical protein